MANRRQGSGRGFLAAALALLGGAACQGAGLDATGSDQAAGRRDLGPLVESIQVVSPPAAPATCGTPMLPYALTSGGQTLQINGQNFRAGAAVRVGKLCVGSECDPLPAPPSDAVTINPTGTQITVNTPPGSPGVANVLVINPDNQAGELAGGLILCADAAGTSATAKIVPAITRLQIGDELPVELRILPGTQDDLRELRPALSVDAGSIAAASIFSGPSPAGADLLVGAPDAVFRYVLVPETEGDLVLRGGATGFLSQIGAPTSVAAVIYGNSPAGEIIHVEPLLVTVDLDRTAALEGQLFRLIVQVGNAGSETVTLLQGEGADSDGDAGPLPPEGVPTPSNPALVTLDLAEARIISGTGACTGAVASPAPGGLPTCSLDRYSIARFDFVYTAATAGTISFNANATGQAITLGTVRGISKTTTILSVSPVQ